jgi:hypothetical protein
MLTRALTVEQLLPLLTINGAYSIMQEDLIGSLTVGKLADMVILSENPLEVEPARLKDIAVLMTMVDGKVEYCAAGAQALCPAAAAPAPVAPAAAAPPVQSSAPQAAGEITSQGTVTASASLATDPITNAVDGDPETTWNSGASPRQWLRFEFGAPRAITGVRLAVSQYPAGPTVHRIWAGTTEENVQQLHEFAGSTADGQVLEFFALSQP